MRILPMAALVTLSVLMAPAVLPAQSLAEVAAKEKEKKKNSKAPKVYTEADLKRAGGGTASAPDGQSATPAADATAKTEAAKPEKEKTDDERRADATAAWRKKLDKAREEQAINQKAADDLQASLNESTAFYSPSRQRAMDQLDEVKNKLAQATQTIADLEDEGRRNGYR
ncbi:MAG TPA: hypothetical protein VN083_06405 [Vicinamibacteria bacterium]|jgi:hypothetical protein|nr:hypothetical protein [Vicinamibacteria bacterium]